MKNEDKMISNISKTTNTKKVVWQQREQTNTIDRTVNQIS